MIDGGDGADSLTLDVYSNFSGFAATGYIKNVETITLENKGTSARDFAAKNVTGVSEYILKDNMTLSQLVDTTAKISIVDRASGTATIAFATAAAVDTGTSDSLAVGLSSFGTDKDNRATLTAANIETLNLTVDGDNFAALGSNSASAITVTGGGSLNLNAVSTGLKTFDASAVTGNVTLDATAVTTAKQITAISTGSGADSIKVDVPDVYGFATIVGGDGADTLELGAGSATAVQFDMSGVETLKLGALAGGLTYSVASTTGLETILIDKTATAVTAAFIQMGASDIIVDSQGASAGPTTVTLDTTGSVTMNVTTPASGATTTSPDANANILTANLASSVDVSTVSKLNYTGTVTANSAESITLTNAGITTGANIASTGAKSLYITNTGGTSTATITTPALELLDITATKKLTVTGDVTAQVLTVNTSGFVDLENITKAESIQLEGAGTVDLGVITGNTSSAVELVATELESNEADTATDSLKVTSITTSTQDILVDVSGVKGVVTIGAITTGGTTGDVTVDATKTGGLVTLSTIAAENVTITATNALSGLAAGGVISVKDTLVYNGSGSAANTADAVSGGGGADIAITPTGTSLTATLNGGLDTDKWTITSADGSETASITVDGDLGAAGADVVTINASDEISIAKVTIDVSDLTGGSAASTVITGGTTLTTNDITGSALKDLITGGALADTIDGGAGNDTIEGGLGADLLTGGAGSDTFVFGSTSGFGGGATTISWTDNGSDGSGTADSSYNEGDVFTFNSAIDRITDFVTGSDKLDASVAGASNIVGSASASLSDGDNVFLTGTWDNADLEFTISSGGADTLVLLDAEAVIASSNDNAGNYVVLLGATPVTGDFI
jgi:hypothetical protein